MHTDAMSDKELHYIAVQAGKWDRKRRNALRCVRDYGECRRWWQDALEQAGMIEFGGPSDSNPYNHYRLTEAGRKELGQ